MDRYLTGNVIKKLRENKQLTQSELANLLSVSDKTVSKWETGRGFPDVTMLGLIGKAFDVSVAELLSGTIVENTNTSANMLRSSFYVCPVCGNIIHTMGKTGISCHGINLPPLEAEPVDEKHDLNIEKIEDEYFVSSNHEMTKEHHISFFAGISTDRLQLVKLYPEGNAETRFKINMVSIIYMYCNRDGLYYKKIIKK